MLASLNFLLVRFERGSFLITVDLLVRGIALIWIKSKTFFSRSGVLRCGAHIPAANFSSLIAMAATERPYSWALRIVRKGDPFVEETFAFSQEVVNLPTSLQTRLRLLAYSVRAPWFTETETSIPLDTVRRPRETPFPILMRTHRR
jgi:hypothetical protein